MKNKKMKNVRKLHLIIFDKILDLTIFHKIFNYWNLLTVMFDFYGKKC